MGNEHSANLFQFKVQRFQGSGNPAPGYSRIDQEQSLPILQQQAVAA